MNCSTVRFSSRSGANRERQQGIGYDAFAEPTVNERYLRLPVVLLSLLLVSKGRLRSLTGVGFAPSG
jgi:hypothetical protein